MTRFSRSFPAALAVAALAACTDTTGSEVDRAMDPLNVIDQSNLSEVMLSAASPEEAVAYFERSLGENPDRVDLKRGLAESLVRAGRAEEALPVWQEVIAHPQAIHDDRMDYADALIRTGDWDGAEAQLDAIPPTHETYKRYRLEAMVADSNREWDRAESFYETAAGLTTRPASVLNNWGFSRLTRGDHAGAEELFLQAISYEPELFTAKNNLVMARAAQGNYQMPLVRMTQIERAQLMHTAALAAIRQGDARTGRTMLAQAIETHPQHFEAAVHALRALDQEA